MKMSFPYKGYAGRILKVDLTSGNIRVEQLPKGLTLNYLGGTGFAARILWDEVKADTDPLSPENILIIATGPVNGTAFPPSGRYMMASKSPLTGIWGESHVGGHLGPELKYAGYDIIVIRGRSSRPIYLMIDDDRVELRDAEKIWGKNTKETVKLIWDELKDTSFKVACIGLAGENLVKIAGVISEMGRAAARTGIGAVWGSKRLKAIAVRGSKDIEVADPDRFMELVKEAIDIYTQGSLGRAAQDTLGRYGTPCLVEMLNSIGRLPTKNHWTGIFKHADKIGGEVIRKAYRFAQAPCMACVIQCGYISYIRGGRYAGTLTKGPEYESIFALGSNCLVSDIEAIIYMNMLCNLYGLDTISTGKVISWAMECYEHGLLTEQDLDGIELRWGDVDAMIKLIDKIARRKGVGEILAEGVKKAAEKFGRGTEKYVIHIKGMEVSGQDPRAHKSAGLSLAIAVRGADHLRALSSIEELGFTQIVAERYGEDKVDALSDRLSEVYKGFLIKDLEDLYAITDSLIICKYGTMWPPIYYFDHFTKLIPLLTGMEEYGDVNYIRLTAERICNLRRCFNVREGVTRKDENLPKRFIEEPMPHGPAKGHVCNLEPMLQEYYRYRRWDYETGLPYRETLEEVGLKDVADQLEAMGKIKRRGS